jgi:hypothetical protein
MVKGLFSAAGSKISEVVQTGTDRLRSIFSQASKIPNPISFLINKLPPRQQMMIIYAQWTTFCGQQGFSRKPFQTPFEFAVLIRSQAPQTIDLVDAITLHFIEARYTRHPIAQPMVDAMRQDFRLFQQKLVEEQTRP